MPARFLIQLTTFCMDFIALLTLAATSEVHPASLKCIPIFMVLAFLSHRQFLKSIFWIRTTRPFFISIIFFYLGLTLFLWLKLHYLLIVAVASSAPLLHASLWLIPEESKIARASELRLALGFVELIIASILTTGFYLTISIFIFTLLSSIAISAGFLDQAFKENKETLSILSPRYITRSISIAFLVLLSAAVLFPILPRTHFGENLQTSSRRTGYTEQVGLDALSPLFGTRGGQVMLRISQLSSSKKVSEIGTLIPFGLLRTKILSHFDGNNWTPGHFQIYRGEPLSSQFDLSDSSFTWLEVNREAMNSEAFSVPYGTTEVTSKTNSSIAHFSRTGEWTNLSLKGTRTQYHVSLPQIEEGHLQSDTQKLSFGLSYGSGPDDLPTSEHLKLFSGSNNQEIKELAHQIFSTQKANPILSCTPSLNGDPSICSVKNPENYVAQINSFFNRQGFTAPTGGQKLSSEENPTQPSPNQSALAYFLTKSHTGNCELFASAAAVLLRIARIPTRLITGFRITRGTVGGILNVRSGDAHAWIEYWIPQKGWKVFDPTPRTILTSTILDQFQDVYDSLEGLWYTYVYSYDARSQVEFGYKGWEKVRNTPSWMLSEVTQNLFQNDRERFLIFGFLAALVLIFVIYLIYRSTEWLQFLSHFRSEDSIQLRLLRRKMDHLIRKSLHIKNTQDFDLFRQESKIEHLGYPLKAAYSQWKEHYLKARFGSKSVPTSDFILQLKQLKNDVRAFSDLLQKSR